MKTRMTRGPKTGVTGSMQAPDSRTRGANGTEQILASLVLALVIMVPIGTLAAAGPAPVDLGSTAHFTLLSGAAITSTGGGIVNGDAGASPIAGSAIGLTAAQVHGTIYATDVNGPFGSVMNPALLTAAKGDLTAAFNDARDRTPVPVGPCLDPGAGNIGGMTLGPGLYKFTSTALIMGTDVTLTGGPEDVWIFQIGTALTVGSGIHVNLAGGAQARNIFWQVGSSATIGTFAVFKGTILASQAITLDTSCTLEGRALASVAAITFNGASGSLPTPEAPGFVLVSRTTANSATVVLSTTPYLLLTLEASPALSLTNWTTIATDTPVASPWTFTDYTATTAVTRRFYRAFITP